MEPNDDLSLIGGGDCHSHFHSDDRVPTQAFLHGLQAVANRTSIVSNYQATAGDDYLTVDTSAENITITLPIARNGNEIEILKRVSANLLVILPSGADTIFGATGVSISSGGAGLHFKSFGTDWRLI